MERVNGIPGAEPGNKNRANPFWTDLLKKMGLQEKNLYKMSASQLFQELQGRNLSSYSNRLKTRIEVLLLVLSLDQGTRASHAPSPGQNRLLSAELLLEAAQLARYKGKGILEKGIRAFLEKEGLKRERDLLQSQFSRLLRETIDNRAELRVLANNLEHKGFLGLQKYLNSADIGLLNRVSAARFLALRNLLNYLLEGQIPAGQISKSDRDSRVPLELPDVYNQMLMAVNRQSLNLILPAVEELSFWSGKELAQAARGEAQSLRNDSELPREIIDFILGRLNRLVFMEKLTGDLTQNSIKPQEAMSTAIYLRRYYPAIFKYYRQLGLPDLPLEEEESLPRLGPCFVAGEVLASPGDRLYIETLKFWRRHYLSKKPAGRVLIYIYYRVGPAIKAIFQKFPEAGKPVRWLLIFIASCLLSKMQKNYSKM